MFLAAVYKSADMFVVVSVLYPFNFLLLFIVFVSTVKNIRICTVSC